MIAVLLALVVYVDPLGTCWSATAHYYGKGPADIPYVWISISSNPRRVFYVPVADIAPTTPPTCEKVL